MSAAEKVSVVQAPREVGWGHFSALNQVDKRGKGQTVSPAEQAHHQRLLSVLGSPGDLPEGIPFGLVSIISRVAVGRLQCRPGHGPGDTKMDSS